MTLSAIPGGAPAGETRKITADMLASRMTASLKVVIRQSAMCVPGVPVLDARRKGSRLKNPAGPEYKGTSGWATRTEDRKGLCSG